MLRFIAGRVGSALLVLFILTVVVFIATRVVPSDPAVAYAGIKAPPEELDRVREELGFNRPLFVQYFDYVFGLFRGDLGTSLSTRRPVMLEFVTRLPATLELLFASFACATTFGVAMGVMATRKPNGVLDGVIRFLSIGGVSMPVFWLGLLLQVLFVGQLGILPATGNFSKELASVSPVTAITGFPLFDSLITANWIAFTDGLAHLVLPVITLAAYPTGLIAKMTRSSMLEAQSQDFVFTARAYGLRERMIRWRLTLKNAISPTLTIAGLSIAYTLTGTFFVELVFNWPGIGQYTVNAIMAVDYPAILGITLLAAVGYLSANVIVDIIQARIDPRVRLTGRKAGS